MTNALRKTEPKCLICGRAGDGELCQYHREASSKIVKHYQVWKERTGIQWKEYLREIAVNESAGLWVREVAIYLLDSDDEGPKAPKGPRA